MRDSNRQRPRINAGLIMDMVFFEMPGLVSTRILHLVGTGTLKARHPRHDISVSRRVLRLVEVDCNLRGGDVAML
ncbi:hypothetical protein JZ785_17935 [Alicyclobacillus curvatus]|nr:hypothetical protein JZ785_17935 [Alicyclobacillus curvatus]